MSPLFVICSLMVKYTKIYTWIYTDGKIFGKVPCVAMPNTILLNSSDFIALDIEYEIKYIENIDGFFNIRYIMYFSVELFQSKKWYL